VAEAVRAKLARVTVGNPRDETVRMGALVSRAQLQAVQAGIAQLREEAELLFDGAAVPLVGADPAVAACIGPTLLAVRDAQRAARVHRVEVFGPVSTLLPYRDTEQAAALVRRGEGSLVCSLYGADPAPLAQTALALADSHGRVHVVSPEVGGAHTGHGNVMPQSLHGGPGRAGGGQELGGLRALSFYLQRSAVQAAAPVLDRLGAVPLPS
jgi:3,4-dehydroadipyl-CoA semialdehyde dehydrogenase